MTYKKACEKIDELCEGWETKHNDYKLETAMYKLSSVENIEKMQDFTRSVFNKVTNGALNVDIGLSDTMGMYVFVITIRSRSGFECEGYSRPWLVAPVGQLTKEQFTRIFLQDIQHVLGRALTTDSIEDLSDLSEIVRGLTLAELAMEQNNFFTTLQAGLAERSEDCKNFNALDQEYTNWKGSIRRAMLNAAAIWFEETSLTPGMTIAIRDLTMQYCATKTLKTLSEDLLEFTDGSYLPQPSVHFHKAGTWFANNDRYRKIATALDFSEVKGLNF